jgi:regulator of protease activity HflC (stomatin/prohibitin superfamily)
MTILDLILGRQRVRVKETERVIALRKAQVHRILGAGEHTLAWKAGDMELIRFDIGNLVFTSPYEKALFDRLPDEAGRHLTVFRTGDNEVAVIERDGEIHTVLAPNQKLVVWTDAGPWTKAGFDALADIEIGSGLLRRLVRARKVEHLVLVSVQQGQVGLVFADGQHVRTVETGLHGYWTAARLVTSKLVELKRQPLDVTGQELLTRDKVTIRVNLTAEYRVVDPVKAVTEVKDYADVLYRALQHVFRTTLGAMTLDQILERKATITAEAADGIRSDMLAIGIEVTAIELKDVILPGEMREILNQVVAAEKQAEANVIRRREETNATRSLLNTAKVMAENPVMLRLKELEALETIAGKVERLTVHNGTGGLLNDLVKLRDA